MREWVRVAGSHVRVRLRAQVEDRRPLAMAIAIATVTAIAIATVTVTLLAWGAQVEGTLATIRQLRGVMAVLDQRLVGHALRIAQVVARMEPLWCH